MCYYSAIAVKAMSLALRYKKDSSLIEKVEDEILDKYVVRAFGCPQYPIITCDDKIMPFQWGLIPNWIKDKKQADEIKLMTMNARSDSLFLKPSFKDSIMHRRCLVPATGYFEWRHDNGEKIPYYIHLKNQEIFSLAGIYDSWIDTTNGEVVNTFSVITTETNPLTDYIHNTKHRMPAILSPSMEGQWLNNDLHQNEIESLLHPYPVEDMDVYRIRKDFLRLNPSDPNIISSIDTSQNIKGESLRLFP